MIPADYKITSIVLEETAGTNVTMNIGTTTGSAEIVNNRIVIGNSIQETALGTTLFSTTSSQIIYIESSAWSTAVVDVHIRIEKFTN